jgi:hypothetical protein
MALLQSERPEVDFPDDTAPFGFWRSPFLDHAASAVIENESQMEEYSHRPKALRGYFRLRNRMLPPWSRGSKFVKRILKVVRGCFRSECYGGNGEIMKPEEEGIVEKINSRSWYHRIEIRPG